MEAITADPDRKDVRRRMMIRIWRALWLITAFCLLFPVRYQELKAALILSGVGICAGALWVYPQWAVRLAVAGIAIFAAAIALLPGRPVDSDALRAAYVRCLAAYRGTPYVWGGGNRLGIDCSGLVQRGLIDAEVQQGLKTANPGLLRAAASLWWHNRNAAALGQGYRGETQPLFNSPSIAQVADGAIRPGDIAVLSDGLHTMAYLGNRIWIEADPLKMKVTELNAGKTQEIYFSMPVRILRWRVLD
jgi:hypothetical protein